MAGDADLGTLQVKLLAEVAGYLKGMRDAQHATDETAKHIEHAAHQIESIGNKMEGFAHNALSALTSLAEFEFLKGAFEDFGKMEGAAIRLNSTLEANGREVKQVTADYAAFAEETAHETMASQLEISGLLKRAEVLGLTGRKAQDAVKDAIALGEATENEAGMMLRLTAAIEKGDTETIVMMSHMRGLREHLGGVTDANEIVTRVQRLANIGMQTASALSESAEGKLHHLAVAWTMLKADLGKAVSEGLKPVIENLMQLVSWLRDLPDYVKENAVRVIALSAAFTALTIGVSLVKSGLTGLTTAFAANPITMWVVAITAAVAIAYTLTTAITESSEQVKRHADNLARLASSQADYLSKYSSTTRGVLAQADEMSPQDRKGFLAEQVKEAEEEVKKYGDLTKKYHDENSGFLAWGARQFNSSFDSRAEEVAMRERMLAAERRVKELTAAGKSPLVVFDMAGVQKEMEQIQEFDKFIKELKNDVDNFNRTTEERKILGNEAALGGQKTQALALVAQKKAMEDAKKFQDDLIDRAAEVRKSVQTPVEALAGSIQDLNTMLDEDKLTWDEYTRAVDKARAASEKMAATQDAMAFGSSGFAKMVSSFQDRAPTSAYDRADPGGVLKNTFGDGEIKRNIQKTADKKAVTIEPAGF